MSPVLAAYTALLVAQSHPMSVECRIIGSGERALAPPARLYTGRHDARFHVGGTTFLDMRYDALANTVAVTVVVAPRATWSFGEKVIERERVFSPPQGSIAIEAVNPDARLVCDEEPAKTLAVHR